MIFFLAEALLSASAGENAYPSLRLARFPHNFSQFRMLRPVSHSLLRRVVLRALAVEPVNQTGKPRIPDE